MCVEPKLICVYSYKIIITEENCSSLRVWPSDF